MSDAFAIHLSVAAVREFLKVALDSETSKLTVSQLFGQAMADLGGIGYDDSNIVRVNPNPLDDMYINLPDVQDAATASAPGAYTI